MDILSYLEQQGIRTEGIEDLLKNLTKTKAYPKGHILLEPEGSSHRVYYVQEGLLRTFYLRDDKDITHHFVAENAFIMPFECIFFDKPSTYGYELLENSVVTTFRYDDLEKISQSIPEVKDVEKHLLYNTIRIFSDTLHSIKFQSARERYDHMIREYPNILLRAPLGHIASYLGITQQTLSVIRAQY